MKKKTILSIILSVMIATSCFAGCGNGENNDTTINSNTQSVVSDNISTLDTSNTESNIDNKSKTESNTTNTSSADDDTSSDITSSEPAESTLLEDNTSNTTSQEEQPQEILPTDITLNSTSLSLTVGESTSLTATVLPNNANNKTVKWYSNNESIAIVEVGKVTAKAAGTTTIVAQTSNGIAVKCTVMVKEKNIEPPKEIIPTSIKVSSSSLSLTVGESTSLTATVTPSNAANKTVKWTSSNTSVATVSNGKVTAKAAGTTTIIAQTSNGIKAVCTVTVKAKPAAVQPTSITINKTFYNYYIDSYVHENFETKAVNECSLNLGNSETLTVTILPTNASDKTVKWSSSDTSVATIDGNGKVTPKKMGTTIITATTSNGISTTCKLTILDRHPYDYPFNADTIKQDMIDYIQSLGVQYVEMTLDDGSWSVPSNTWMDSYARLKDGDWSEADCERLKAGLYDRIDSELRYFYTKHPDGKPSDVMMCPYIYEDEKHPGHYLITVVYC